MSKEFGDVVGSGAHRLSGHEVQVAGTRLDLTALILTFCFSGTLDSRGIHAPREQFTFKITHTKLTYMHTNIHTFTHAYEFKYQLMFVQ